MWGAPRRILLDLSSVEVYRRTHVRKPRPPRGYSGTASPGLGGRRRGRSHALQPGGRLVQLGLRRQRLGRAPDPVQRLDAAGVGDRVAELLAQLVLAHLQVEAE